MSFDVKFTHWSPIRGKRVTATVRVVTTDRESAELRIMEDYQSVEILEVCHV